MVNKRKQIGTNMNILLSIRVLPPQGQPASIEELSCMPIGWMILLACLRTSPFPQPRKPELPIFHS